MNIFELAVALTTTGEDQVAAAMKKVETAGAGAASAVSRAWDGVTLAPAIAETNALGASATKLTGTLSEVTPAAAQAAGGVDQMGASSEAAAAQTGALTAAQTALATRTAAAGAAATTLSGKMADTGTAAKGAIAQVNGLANAEQTLTQRMRAALAAASVKFQGGPPPQAIENVTAFSKALDRVPRAMFAVGAASAGIPGPLGRVAEVFLQLGAGGVVVGAVSLGMALIGQAIQKAREKADQESQRIAGVIQKWQDKLDEMTGRARRKEIEDLAGDVEKLAAALAAARLNQQISTQGAPSTSPLVAQRAAEVKAAEDALADAQRRLDLRRSTHDTGPGSDEDKRKHQEAIDKERTAYEQYLTTLQKGVAITATAQASRDALFTEEAKLSRQLEAGNLPLAERIRLGGLLVQVQTALGDLPETDESRAAAIERLRQSEDAYLQTLNEAVRLEAAQPSEIARLNTELDQNRQLLTSRTLSLQDYLATQNRVYQLEQQMSAARARAVIPTAAEEGLRDAYTRTQAALRNVNLTLEDRVRLERQLADIRASLGESDAARRADQRAILNAQINENIREALGGNLQADIAIMGANTEAALRAIGPRLSEAAQQAFEGVRSVFATAPAQLVTTFAEGLGQGLSDRNAKTKDIVLQGLGNILASMGQALIAYGITMTKLLPHLLNPFTSGPAAIAAGAILVALGKSLGGLASGHGGGGGGSAPSGPSFDSYKPNTEQIVRIVVNPPAGQQTAAALVPPRPMNVTIIGPADPVAQRAIADLYNNAQARGLIRKP